MLSLYSSPDIAIVTAGRGGLGRRLVGEPVYIPHIRGEAFFRGLVRIGEPGGGLGSWCVSSGVFAVGGVCVGEGFHGPEYTTGCGGVDVIPQPVGILAKRIYLGLCNEAFGGT